MLSPQLQPPQSSPTEVLSSEETVNPTPDETGTVGAPVEGDESATIVKNLQAHLDQLQDKDKQFLAEHLTPEFVRAIGLINGPEVAGYLAQFVDEDKVMVPVPRQIAEQYRAEQQGGAQPQGQPQQPIQAQPQAAPQNPGMMAPQ